MSARLGPQAPSKDRSHTTTTQEVYPRPSAMLVSQGYTPQHPVLLVGGHLVNKAPLCSIRRRLDDMLFTPFSPRIISYKPLRRFLMPKFSTYDGSNNPFDYMHYQQLMTLDIGNDLLLCKVFPVSLQGQTLSWFHWLPTNSVDNFKDLSEVFMG